MEDAKGLMLRLPAPLYTKLVRETGEQTAKTGTRVSLNRLIVDILEAYFEKRTAKKG